MQIVIQAPKLACDISIVIKGLGLFGLFMLHKQFVIPTCSMS